MLLVILLVEVFLLWLSVGFWWDWVIILLDDGLSFAFSILGVFIVIKWLVVIIGLFWWPFFLLLLLLLQLCSKPQHLMIFSNPLLLFKLSSGFVFFFSFFLLLLELNLSLEIWIKVLLSLFSIFLLHFDVF